MLRAARPAVAAVVVAAGLAGPPAPGIPPAGASRPAVERVLVVTLPGVTWQDVATAEAPRLRGLLAGSAVASASLRVFHRTTSVAEGYATLGAGALMNGHRRLAARARPVGDGGIVSPAAPMLRALNEHRRRGAEVGALGDALAGAGVSRAVVANADTSLTDPDENTWHREATLVLAGSDGRVPGGTVDRSLLRADPGVPFGTRLDPGAVAAAVRAVSRPRSVVVLEASDLARVQVAAGTLAPERRRALVASALATTDAVLAGVLAGLDDGTAVIVITPSTPAGSPHLGVAALRAPGLGPGWLVSGSTGRAGLVTLADVAPTVLALLGVPRPPAMEGRPFEVGHRGRAGFAALIEADRESRLRDGLVAPVTRGLVAAEVVLALAGAVVLAGRARRLRPVVSFAALWLLGMLPVAWLPATFDARTPGAWWAMVVGGGLVVAGVAAGRGRTALVRLTVPLGLLLVLLVADVVTGAGFQLSAVFGYSPTAGGRYSGFGNLAFAQVAAAGALLAAAVAHLVGGRRGAWAGVGVLAVTVVADGLPAWGADVGGVLAGLPGFAVVAAGLLGVRLSSLWFLGLAGTAVATVAAFGGLDLLRPPSQRTHLGRLLERMGDDGLAPLSDVIARKADAAWDLTRPGARRWLPLVPAGAGFVALVSFGPRTVRRRWGRRTPEVAPAVAGVLLAGALGFALNDSGVAVPAMMLAVLTPFVVHLAVDG